MRGYWIKECSQLSPNNSPTPDWQSFSNAFTKLYLITKPFFKSLPTGRPPWFDNECLMKKKLKATMRLAQRHSSLDIQAKMLSLRKEYRKLIKLKKCHIASIWSGFELSAKSGNSDIFWHCVAWFLKEKRFAFSTPIFAEDWETIIISCLLSQNLLGNSS